MMRTRANRETISNFIYKDGEVVQVTGSVVVMVSGEGDLTNLAERLEPGSIAYTSGWGEAWQLGLDGTTWTSMQ